MSVLSPEGSLNGATPDVTMPCTLQINAMPGTRATAHVK